MKTAAILTSLAALVGFGATVSSAGSQCASAQAASAGAPDIVDTAIGAGSFKTLAAALKAADLVDTLKGPGPFTVFAPTDEAFAKLPAGTLDELLKPANKAKLASILTYHVVPGSVMAADVVKLSNAPTVNGQRIAVGVKGAEVTLNGRSKVVKTDIACGNGVIHVIDSVILPVEKTIPQVAADAGSFTTLAKALDAAGLTEALTGKGPFTVFAPTDEAFQKLPAGTLENLLKPENKAKLQSILKFHVLPGAAYADRVVKMTSSGNTLQGQAFQITLKDGKVRIGNKAAMAGVTATDIQASNGVIHVIDSVIMPE